MMAVNHKLAGFSIIELLMVVVIVGILAAFAYPSYRDSVVRSNRSDAHIAIQKVSMAEERYFAVKHQYTETIADVGGSATQQGHYTLSVVTGIWTGTDCSAATSTTDLSSYTIFAIPAGNQATGDSECTCIHFNSRGDKGSTGTRSNPEDCW